MSPTFFSIPLTSHQKIAPVEATDKELRSIQKDWDTRAQHTMCENAVLQNEPAIRNKLRQMEEALGRKQLFRYREHRRMMGDILHYL